MDTQELFKQVVGIPTAASSLIIDVSNHPSVTASTGSDFHIGGLIMRILSYNMGIDVDPKGNKHLGRSIKMNGCEYSFHRDPENPKHPLVYTNDDNRDNDIVIVKKIGEKLLLLTHFLIPTMEDLQSQYENTVSNLTSASTLSSA